MFVDEVGVDRAAAQARVGEQLAQKAQVGGHPFDARFRKRPPRLVEGAGEVALRGVDHQLGQQRIKGRAGGVAGIAEAVRPQAGAVGQLERCKRSAGGPDAAVSGQGLHVDAGLDGEPAGRGNFALGQAKVRERPALGDLQLRQHQIQAADLLGHRVLHLQAGVGLDEGEAVAGHQKLHRAGAAVADCPAQTQGGVDQGLAQVFVQVGAGRHLHDLLPPSLNAALPLPQMRQPVAVAEQLHFHMAGFGQIFLHIEGGVAEGGLRLGGAAGEGFLKGIRRFHHPHAPSAAASHCLDQDGSAVQAVHEGGGLRQSNRPVATLQQGDAATRRQAPRLGFVPQRRERVRRRPHKGDALRLQPRRKLGVLAQKAVARMHRVTAVRQRQGDDLLHVQIGADAAPLQGQGLISAAPVQGLGVLRSINRHAGQAGVQGGAGDANGDFAAVGDEQLFHGGWTPS